MNTSQGALHFSAGIDRTQWNRDIEAMRRDIAGLSQTATNEARNMDSAFKNLSTGILGYFSIGAIRSFVMELVNVRGEFQKTEIAFSTMLGSGVKAAQLMDQMVVLAAKTPFSLQEVSSGAKQLLAFQIPANQVVDTLTRMGNIAAGLGVPLSRINLVYGQVKAKGKLMGDDLRQFTEAGIPMVAELAEKFGKTDAEITAMVSAGKIGFKDVKEVLFNLTNEGGMFYNLMEKQSASVTGQIANLGDAWDQMLNQMGQSNEGLIYDSIAGLATLVENYQEVIKVLQVLIITYGAYRAALIATAALQGRLVAPAVIQGLKNLISLIRGATVAQTALNAASLANPYVLLATAIAGIVAILITYRKEIKDLMTDYKGLEQQIKYNEKVQEKYSNTFSKGISENREKIVSLIAVINSENSKLEDRKKAYEKLIKIDDSFRGALDAQYRATFKLGDAFDYVIGKMQKFALVQAEMAVKQEYLRQNAEDEFNLNIAQVKFDEAQRVTKKYGDLLKQGKIDIKEYAAYVKPYEDVAVNLIKAQKAVKESRKEADYSNKAEKQKLETLRKQETILNAQINGGKIQGKIISEATKAKLIRKLKDVQDEIKLRLGETFEEIEKDNPTALGYVEKIEAKIDELREAYKKALTPEAARAINEEIAKWQAKLDALNPKKDKKENQLAEIFPHDSIKDLEQKAQLINDALQTVENGVVRLRKLDKYGKDKDKKGNPYYTGETVSQEEAVRRLAEINARLAEKRRDIEARSFEDEIREVKRQFEVRDRLLKSGYSKGIVDEMFPKVKDKTFIQYLNETGQALDKIKNKRSAEDLIKLQDILTDYTGEATFVDSVNKQIDELKAKFKGDELIEKLERFRGANLEGTTGDDRNSKNILIKKAIDEELDRQKSAYRDLLEEHKSFGDRKIRIEKETAIAIKKINEDPSLNPDQKKGYLEKVDRKSKEEISQLAVDELTKSKAWMSLYGNIDDLTEYQMNVLLKELESRKSQLAKVLTPVDFSILLKNFREVKEKISEENPFLGLFNSLQELFSSFGSQSEEAGQQGYDAFDKASRGIKGTLKAAKGIIGALEPAREYMSDAANDAIDTIDKVATMGLGMMEAIDGTVKAVKTALDQASWSNWITAIISIIYTVIKAVVSLFSWIAGNKTKKINREIKSWQMAVDDLKNSYEDLQRVIEKTAGEAQLAMQRGLISNLKEQQRILEQMRAAESKKKKADQDKIATYTNQIREINNQIQQVVDDFKLSILSVDFKDFAQKLSDSLVEAFGKGEDAALSFEKVANDVMKNAVINALKIKFLQPVADEFVNKLYSSMGFGNDTKATEQKNALESYKKALAEVEEKLKGASILSQGPLKSLKKYYEEMIAKVNAEIAAGAMSGSFDGLSPEEIKILQDDYKNDPRIKGFLEGIKNINELFDTTIEGAQGLKGDIKGITEKTAGALEGQFNAVRINIVEIVKMMQGNQLVSKNQTLLLSQIEYNTRRLHSIDENIKELNVKTKGKLAGI